MHDRDVAAYDTIVHKVDRKRRLRDRTWRKASPQPNGVAKNDTIDLQYDYDSCDSFPDIEEPAPKRPRFGIFGRSRRASQVSLVPEEAYEIDPSLEHQFTNSFYDINAKASEGTQSFIELLDGAKTSTFIRNGSQKRKVSTGVELFVDPNAALQDSSAQESSGSVSDRSVSIYDDTEDATSVPTSVSAGESNPHQRYPNKEMLRRRNSTQSVLSYTSTGSRNLVDDFVASRIGKRAY